ncbi:accessory Sec system protein Asp3 [Lactobacillus sp. ESL0701]|uniref:accessory Sec system protein Asp3 n=1 Tax=Lactobacillus sp. ESL0701 TaxID=2983217 RepID=UPI0023F75E68|nr:accessory Sec system protein Asp3 [Lactobacillus sp. ESL0701]MDF7672410.1 accessory Sec system protein Asp3 [Lactobacillus sp. ESL0701]
MTEKKLLTAHFFFRPQNMAYIYLYGAKVNFRDEDLFYQNAIVSPGKAIVTWEERHLETADFVPNITMPRLAIGTKYQYQIESEEQPIDSIALALTTYDSNLEQRDYRIFTSKEGEFSLEPEEVKYRFDLASLGNQKLYFQHLLLAEVPVLEEYTFTVKDIGNIRTIWTHYNKRSDFMPVLNVCVRTHTSTVQTISFEPQQDNLFIFIPVQINGQGQFDDEQIDIIVKYINEIRTQGYVLQIENNQSTTSLVKAIQQNINND